jgi:hypothetical protein
MEEATALARQASAAELTILSKILSFTSEQQRLAYLNIFDPYSLFPVLKGTEADLATAVLRYKGVVLDSIIEDRLLAQASKGSEDQKLVDQLNLDKSELGQLLLQPAQKLSAETNQRMEALEMKVEKMESQHAQHVVGLGHARRALVCALSRCNRLFPTMVRSLSTCGTCTTWGKTNGRIATEPLCCYQRVRPSAFRSVRPTR